MTVHTCPDCGASFDEYHEEWDVRSDGAEDLVRFCPVCDAELDRFAPFTGDASADSSPRQGRVAEWS